MKVYINGMEREDPGRYAGWITELAGLLRPGARVLDLGCGAGIAATRQLTRRGLQVIGVDFSAPRSGTASSRKERADTASSWRAPPVTKAL